MRALYIGISDHESCLVGCLEGVCTKVKLLCVLRGSILWMAG